MIEIDDAGTGDLLGDAFIGFYRKSTDQLVTKSIPVELFYEKPWKDKAPFSEAVEVVKETFKEMNVTLNELVKICRGNFFDKVRSYFIKIGQHYEDSVIEGKLQDAVEGAYVNHIRKLGLKSNSLTIESGKKRFFVQFGWVSRNIYKREKYVKSGFKKWQTVWRDKAIEQYEKFNKSRGNYSKGKPK